VNHHALKTLSAAMENASNAPSENPVSATPNAKVTSALVSILSLFVPPMIAVNATNMA
jgi:hypothetical protein